MPFLTLAPLHGVTNRIFRTVYESHFDGMDAVMAPFIHAVDTTATVPALPERHLKDIAQPDREILPLTPQLIGNNASAFTFTAHAIAMLGFKEVNWNLGCPYPMVAKKRKGSGLLPFPDLIDRFLEDVFKNIRIRISVKVRLGYRDKHELTMLMPILNRYPLSCVIVHPRIGIQMYKGAVDLDAFEEVASLCAHPIIYNGDILTREDFCALTRRFPTVSSWMIGRGALADPFLPAAIKGLPVPHDRRPVLRAYHDALYDAYRTTLFGPSHVLDKMKEQWTYLAASFPTSERLRTALKRARSFTEYEAAVDRLFDQKSVQIGHLSH